MIIGLEDDMYCAHTPIPVRVTSVSADTIRMQIYIDEEPMLPREPILCQDLNGDFLIDLSPWVKQFMPSFRDNMTYQPGMQYNPNPQAMEMRVEFYSQDGFDEAERTFVNCATKDWRLIDDEFVNVKVWQCYPFSKLLGGSSENDRGYNFFSILDYDDNKVDAPNIATIWGNSYSLKPNTKYVVSTNIPMGGTSFYNSFFDIEGNNPSSSANGVGEGRPRVVTSDSTGNLVIYIRKDHYPPVLTGEYWIKLEEGDTPTNWIPNPEDVTDGSNIYYGIPSTESFVLPGKSVEYNTDCCRGIYVKWLNRYGYYSYWLFPERYTRERSADEYYKVTQNIFDSNRDGSHRTVGFEAEDIITIRDKVSRKYIGMFADLVSSPEVQILKPDYVLGSDVTPDDWIRIIQDSPELEDDAANSTFDFEMDFTLPKRYTQTLI